MLLSIASIANAQQKDLGIAVKKKSNLTITPDSMYFDSRVSRRFVIRGVPAGGKLKGTFRGSPIYAKDSMIMLQPMCVYRDSDVAKYKGYRNGLTSNESSTSDKFYVTGLILRVVDANGVILDSLTRTCYIKPQDYNPSKNIPLSSATFDPLMTPLLKSAGLDSNGPDDKTKKVK